MWIYKTLRGHSGESPSRGRVLCYIFQPASKRNYQNIRRIYGRTINVRALIISTPIYRLIFTARYTNNDRNDSNYSQKSWCNGPSCNWNHLRDAGHGFSYLRNRCPLAYIYTPDEYIRRQRFPFRGRRLVFHNHNDLVRSICGLCVVLIAVTWPSLVIWWWVQPSNNELGKNPYGIIGWVKFV